MIRDVKFLTLRTSTSCRSRSAQREWIDNKIDKFREVLFYPNFKSIPLPGDDKEFFRRWSKARFFGVFWKQETSHERPWQWPEKGMPSFDFVVFTQTALILASKRMHLMASALMLSGLQWIFQWAYWLKNGVTKHNKTKWCWYSFQISITPPFCRWNMSAYETHLISHCSQLNPNWSLILSPTSLANPPQKQFLQNPAGFLCWLNPMKSSTKAPAFTSLPKDMGPKKTDGSDVSGPCAPSALVPSICGAKMPGGEKSHGGWGKPTSMPRYPMVEKMMFQEKLETHDFGYSYSEFSHTQQLRSGDLWWIEEICAMKRLRKMGAFALRRLKSRSNSEFQGDPIVGVPANT